MFSATSSFVAVISKIDELDSSALAASTSTCCAMSRSALVMSLMDRAVSSLAESCVPTPSPRRFIKSSSTSTAARVSARRLFFRLSITRHRIGEAPQLLEHLQGGAGGAARRYGLLSEGRFADRFYQHVELGTGARPAPCINNADDTPNRTHQDGNLSEILGEKHGQHERTGDNQRCHEVPRGQLHCKSERKSPKGFDATLKKGGKAP